MQRQIEDTGSVMAGGAAAGEFRVRDVVRHALRIDQRFNGSYETMRVAQRIAESLDGGPGPFGVDEGDWEKLCEALRTPMPQQGLAPYPLAPSYVCIPLIDLVLNAKKAAP